MNGTVPFWSNLPTEQSIKSGLMHKTKMARSQAELRPAPNPEIKISSACLQAEIQHDYKSAHWMIIGIASAPFVFVAGEEDTGTIGNGKASLNFESLSSLYCFYLENYQIKF